MCQERGSLFKDCGAQVHKFTDYVQFVTGNADMRLEDCILCHDLCLLQADGKAGLLTGLAELSHELLRIFG